MTVLNKKSRMISFRLSANQYTEALECCAQQGHRSVSALARSATLSLLPGCEEKAIVNANDFVEMQEQIYRLRTEIDRISSLIPGSRSAARRDAVTA